MTDYIVYRAGGIPSLTRIPNPNPNFYDEDVDLLPRAGGLFTAAALVAKPNGEYTLHRLDSEFGNWALKTASLGEPRKPYPMKVPMNALRLNHHITTTVISLGGRAGTMGWVDLWTGILLYDLFHGDEERPMLRHMLLPLPMPHISPGSRELGCPRYSRGFACVVKHGEPCIKLADLQILETRLPYYDIETDLPCYIVHDWALKTWVNKKMGYSNSFDDLLEDFTIWASQIIISDTVRSELLASGLLCRKPSCDDEEAVNLDLQNLAVSDPTPSLNGEEDVIYLIARPKHYYSKAWALAIDIKNRSLLSVSEFGTDEKPILGVTYCSSAISSYMDL